MRNILTLSKREITRLRARFSGRSRFLVPAIMLLTVVASLVIYQQDVVVSKGLYNVGTSPEAPQILDKRFLTYFASKLREQKERFELRRKHDISAYPAEVHGFYPNPISTYKCDLVFEIDQTKCEHPL